MSKNVKIQFQSCLAFDLAFMTFVGLFEIFLDFQGLRSLVPCSNHENGHSIIKNSYRWKFPILNQCEWHAVVTYLTNFEGL